MLALKKRKHSFLGCSEKRIFLTLKEGTKLVKFARMAVEEAVSSTELVEIKEEKEFKEKQGVFVTLHSYPSHELRGCIGFPYPIMPLGKAVKEAARAAALQDPRFFPLAKEEPDNIIIEISVLTKPELIDCAKNELSKNIKIGKDGLICSFHGRQGLLLPQVAPEQGWNAQQFLEQDCIKAGLPRTIWKNKACEIYKFQAQIFSETSPLGKVIEKKA